MSSARLLSRELFENITKDECRGLDQICVPALENCCFPMSCIVRIDANSICECGNGWKPSGDPNEPCIFDKNDWIMLAAFFVGALILLITIGLLCRCFCPGLRKLDPEAGKKESKCWKFSVSCK
ncbi:uncharacterized protein LOC132200749 [Neocloeon triangulifer]|uniref:uncharacterized protein LOC132200749 n=1 Tax=Neocloeon triangulifer TaxID=2078957 RepID=UPI00286FAD66|nr:uncharacterized protein LOC132200749 [Neocloeon triangulifer]